MHLIGAPPRWVAAALLALPLSSGEVIMPRLLGAVRSAQEPSAHDIVARSEQALWGATVQAQLTMTVTTPRWERTLELQSWMERPQRTFIRILAPAKEAGIASLRIRSEMWNYLPNVERTTIGRRWHGRGLTRTSPWGGSGSRWVTAGSGARPTCQPGRAYPPGMGLPRRD